MLISEIKEKLPDVKVKVRGEMYDGMLSGRQNQFATVSVKIGGKWESYQFAWLTIAHAINNHSTLLV